MNVDIAVTLALYLIIICGIGYIANRKMSETKGSFLSEYFIGSRSMGGFVLAMTLVASYVSASSFVGGPGMAYKMGLGWVLLAMIQVPTAYLTLGFLGKKFAIVARKINAITINDFLRARYESTPIVIMASISLLLFFTAAIVAQFIGGARLFEAIGLPYEVGLAIFAITVIFYTVIGGFRAVVLTDAFQGIVMMLGTLALVFGITKAAGGMNAISAKLMEINPDLLTPFGVDGFITKPFILSFWILVCFGIIGLPHTAVRCIGYKDSKSMHRAIVIGTFVTGFLMLGMHLAGALGRAVLPNIEAVDSVIPTLTVEVLPPIFAGIFLAGPMASIMSTVDSQLILASAAIINDLYVGYINPDAAYDDKKIRRISLLITTIIGVTVFLVAFKPPSLIVWINLFAFGGLEAVFFWPIVMGLYWKRATASGALASMITGVILFIALSKYAFLLHGLHPIVPTFVVTFVVFIVTSYLSKPSVKAVIRVWE
jgi:sodium/pantothenate symporter